MRTSSQILLHVYTAAQCCDGNDARIALEMIYEKATAEEQMLPAVLRRIIALRKVLRKHEPEAFESLQETTAREAAKVATGPIMPGEVGDNCFFELIVRHNDSFSEDDRAYSEAGVLEWLNDYNFSEPAFIQDGKVYPCVEVLFTYVDKDGSGLSMIDVASKTAKTRGGRVERLTKSMREYIREIMANEVAPLEVPATPEPWEVEMPTELRAAMEARPATNEFGQPQAQCGLDAARMEGRALADLYYTVGTPEREGMLANDAATIERREAICTWLQKWDAPAPVAVAQSGELPPMVVSRTCQNCGKPYRAAVGTRGGCSDACTNEVDEFIASIKSGDFRKEPFSINDAVAKAQLEAGCDCMVDGCSMCINPDGSPLKS